MTKKDEFIKKIEQLDSHLEVKKYHNLYDHDYNKVDMVVWYTTDVDAEMLISFTYNCGIPVIETEQTRFNPDEFDLYIKVAKLCADYFQFLFDED